MTLYSILLFLLFFCGLRWVKWFHAPQLSVWILPLAFAFKVLISLIFLYLYTFIIGDGTLSEDAGVFMRESAMLHDVFWKSPSAYFKLMTGIGENQALIEQFLPETTHWDVGVQSIINDNKNILRVHSLIHFFSFKSAFIHALISSFIALLGVRHIYIAVKDRMHIRPLWIFLGLLLLPSALFWSSSVLKEPFMILGFGLLLRAIFNRTRERKLFLYGAFGALLLLGFKPSVFLAFLPAFLFFGIASVLPKHKIKGALLSLLLLASLAFLLFPVQREHAIQTISRKQFDFNNVARGGVHVYADTLFYYFSPDQMPSLRIENDSLTLKNDLDAQILKLGQIDKPVPVHLKADGTTWRIYFQNAPCNGFVALTPIDNSYIQLLKNCPEALFNVFFRPLPTDPGSSLKYPAFLETLLLFLFLTWAIFHRRALTSEEHILIVGLLIFAFVLSLLIGWTTPVLGAIVRYRIPVYLVLLIIAGIIWQPKHKKTIE